MKYWHKTITFFKDVRAELRKVSWPSKEGVITSTKVVLMLSVIIGLYVGGLDAMFRFVVNNLLGLR